MRHAVACAFLLLSSAAGAVSFPELSPIVEHAGGHENDVAVVVGIGDYPNLPPIAGATQNATDWNAYLRDALGARLVLRVAETDATREEILEAARTAAHEATANGTLWFIFIGHGAPTATGDDGLLIGQDARPTNKSIQARGVSQKELLDVLATGKQANTVAIFDACFSGAGAAGETPLVPGTQATVPVRRAGPKSSTTVLSASDSFAGPLPGHQRPAFSYLLLGALSGWAQTGSGEISLASAFDYTRRELIGSFQSLSRAPSSSGDLASTRVRSLGRKSPELARAFADEGAARDADARDHERLAAEQAAKEKIAGPPLAEQADAYRRMRDARSERVLRPIGAATTAGALTWTGIAAASNLPLNSSNLTSPVATGVAGLASVGGGAAWVIGALGDADLRAEDEGIRIALRGADDQRLLHLYAAAESDRDFGERLRLIGVGLGVASALATAGGIGLIIVDPDEVAISGRPFQSVFFGDPGVILVQVVLPATLALVGGGLATWGFVRKSSEEGAAEAVESALSTGVITPEQQRLLEDRMRSASGEEREQLIRALQK